MSDPQTDPQTPNPSNNEPAPQEPTAATPAPSEPAPAAEPSPPADPTGEKNWRDEMAGGDEALRKQLDRFNSASDVTKSWLEMRKKMDSGEYKRNVPFNAEWSDEEKSQWRKENGVPESIEGYKLPDGLVIGENDKAGVEAFLNKALEANVPDYAAGSIVDWYFEQQNQAQAAEVAQQKQFEVQTEEALRERWGPEYLANKNMAESFAVEQFGEDIGAAIMSAGPDAVEAVARIAREINPAMTVVPNSGTPNKAIADELAELKKRVGTPGWYQDTASQERYKQLVSAQSKMNR